MEISKPAAVRMATIFFSFLALSFLAASIDYEDYCFPPPSLLNRTCTTAVCGQYCFSTYRYPNGYCDMEGYCVCYGDFPCDADPCTGNNYCKGWCESNGYLNDSAFCDEQGTCFCTPPPPVQQAPSPPSNVQSPSPSPCT
ncbi:hypothetical protein SLA2020_195450 [Shorea laevis]